MIRSRRKKGAGNVASVEEAKIYLKFLLVILKEKQTV
jgi:hypothetical protein